MVVSVISNLICAGGGGGVKKYELGGYVPPPMHL